MTNRGWDVAIVGGGPAGSAAATLLAGAGHRVLMIERDVFPRHHVGESTLLTIHSVLRWLGVAEQVEAAGFRRKTGASYIWGKDREPWSFHFSELQDPGDGWRRPYSYEVERELFDHILLERATDCGAELLRAEVEELLRRDGRVTGVRCRRPDGEVEDAEAHWVVDASGQACLAGTRFGWRRPNPDLRAAALYGYWRGGPPPYELLGGDLTRDDRSNILVCSTDWGWVWVIPQRDDRVSVGAVVTAGSERPPARGVEDAYHRLVRDCDELRPVLDPLEPDPAEPVRSVSDWSYVCDRFTAPGLFLAGDAACFVDPILSSGLHLSMRAGTAAACAVGSLCTGGSEELVSRWYENTYREAYHQYEAMALWWYHGDSRQKRWFEEALDLTGGGAADGSRSARQAFVELASGMPCGGYVTVPLGAGGGVEITLASLFHPYASYMRHLPRLRERLGPLAAPADAPAPEVEAPAVWRGGDGGVGLAPSVELRLQADPERVTLELLAVVGREAGEAVVPVTELWPVLARMDGRRSVLEIAEALDLEEALHEPLAAVALQLQRRGVLTNVT